MQEKSQQVTQVRNIAKKLASKKPTHDWDHTLRVLNLAHRIASKETRPVEALTLDLAVYLHDVAREKEDESGGKIDHVHEGVKLAREILEREGFSDPTIQRICDCIQTHRFRKKKGENQPQTVEAEILFDADKLDSIGAIGVARAFMYAGENGFGLYREPPPEYKPKNRNVDPSVHTPNIEFEVKLRKIKNVLFTEEGRRIADSRHAIMKEFFQRLRLEIEGKL
ncbi:MAG: HD domain-containing protein [Candidatus Thorarchaeota archaeon]